MLSFSHHTPVGKPYNPRRQARRSCDTRYGSWSYGRLWNIYREYAECEQRSQWIAEGGMNWAKAHELSFGHELRYRALRTQAIQFTERVAQEIMMRSINSWHGVSNHHTKCGANATTKGIIKQKWIRQSPFVHVAGIAIYLFFWGRKPWNKRYAL